MKPQARSEQEQQRLDAALVELFEHRIAFNQVLGLRIASVQPGDVRATFAMRPELVGHSLYGRLHGGVAASVLDAMGGLALMVAIAERHPADNAMQVMQRFAPFATIDLRTDFIAAGLGQHFICTAEPVHLGGRIGRAQMRLVNDSGKLIATGSGAYVVG